MRMKNLASPPKEPVSLMHVDESRSLPGPPGDCLSSAPIKMHSTQELAIPAHEIQNHRWPT